MSDWPIHVGKPDLPDGYRWLCLRQALGLGEDGARPWWIRACWTIKNGNERCLKMNEEYFDSPIEAVNYGLHKIYAHKKSKEKS